MVGFIGEFRSDDKLRREIIDIIHNQKIGAMDLTRSFVQRGFLKCLTQNSENVFHFSYSRLVSCEDAELFHHGIYILVQDSTNHVEFTAISALQILTTSVSGCLMYEPGSKVIYQNNSIIVESFIDLNSMGCVNESSFHISVFQVEWNFINSPELIPLQHFIMPPKPSLIEPWRLYCVWDRLEWITLHETLEALSGKSRNEEADPIIRLPPRRPTLLDKHQYRQWRDNKQFGLVSPEVNISPDYFNIVRLPPKQRQQNYFDVSASSKLDFSI